MKLLFNPFTNQNKSTLAWLIHFLTIHQCYVDLYKRKAFSVFVLNVICITKNDLSPSSFHVMCTTVEAVFGLVSNSYTLKYLHTIISVKDNILSLFE